MLGMRLELLQLLLRHLKVRSISISTNVRYGIGEPLAWTLALRDSHICFNMTFNPMNLDATIA